MAIKDTVSLLSLTMQSLLLLGSGDGSFSVQLYSSISGIVDTILAKEPELEHVGIKASSQTVYAG
jgi:hypothetical protein